MGTLKLFPSIGDGWQLNENHIETDLFGFVSDAADDARHRFIEHRGFTHRLWRASATEQSLR